MKKLKKIITEALASLNKCEFAKPVLTLQRSDVREFIYDFIYKDENDITDNDVDIAKDIMTICRSIYDTNICKTIKFRSIDDDTYDNMLERFRSLSVDDPFPKTIPAGMRSISHDYPELVGTLDKAYTIYDTSKRMSLEKYILNICKKYKLQTLSISVAPKYDGSSMSTTFEIIRTGKYAEAKPVKSTSRGDFDSNRGVDMGAILRSDETIYVDDEWCGKIGEQFGIQYEIMVNEAQRKRLSKLTKIHYATRRAASAAVIKRILNPNISDEEYLKLCSCVSLVPVSVSEDLLFARNITWYTAISKLKFGYGDILPKELIVITGEPEYLLEELQKLAAEYSEKRKSMDYNIDGLVISIIDETMRKDLGRSNNRNKWQIAYKFGAIVQRTRISDYIINDKGEHIQTNGIITTFGRMGFLGHNITFDAIEFNGVTYCKAPVNNIARFKTLSPHIGDEVLVSYNADVMGYIYKDDTCIDGDGPKVKLSTDCPRCGEQLVVERDMLKCINDNCSGVAIGKILDIINILDMDFFGEATAEHLVSIGITDIPKFVNMSKETLGNVIDGQKSLDKLYEEFKTKITADVDYAKILDMLRIPNLGHKKAKSILLVIEPKKLLSLISDKDPTALASMLRTVRGIDTNGMPFAKALIEKSDELRVLLKLFKVVDINNKEYNKIVLVSGFRKNPDVERICAKKNWGITDSGKYDILVVTADRINGTKAINARQKNKTIYTLSDFIDTFKDEL